MCLKRPANFSSHNYFLSTFFKICRTASCFGSRKPAKAAFVRVDAVFVNSKISFELSNLKDCAVSPKIPPIPMYNVFYYLLKNNYEIVIVNLRFLMFLKCILQTCRSLNDENHLLFLLHQLFQAL